VVEVRYAPGSGARRGLDPDGLEITIAASVGPDLALHSTLGRSASAVADLATWYLIGEVIGALFFGRLSDRLGCRDAACPYRTVAR
jgi:MFS family permease